MSGEAGSRPVPWGLGDVVGVFVVTAVVTVVLANVLALAGAALDAPDLVRGVQLPLPLATLGIVTVVWVAGRHGDAGALAGPAGVRGREVLLGIGWGIAAFVVVNVLFGLAVQVGAEALGVELDRPQEQLREAARDPGLLPWFVLSSVLVAPLAEELYFRGLLLPALRARIGRWGAIVASAVLFAIAHLLAEGTLGAGALIFVLILPLGVFLGWLFDRRGSLVAPIVVHMVFNAVTTALLIAARSGVLAS